MSDPRRARRAGAAAAVLTAVAATTVAVTATPSSAAACSSGYVALTFDDGPSAASTRSLLSVLASTGARATMFNVGQNVAADPSLVRAEHQAGMWVENHSYTHPHLTTLSASQMRSELARTQQAVVNAGVPAPTIFRPPYGETNTTLRSVARDLGLTTVTWTVDSKDWNGATTAQIVQAASGLRPGGVMLMHDGYATTRAAIPQIVANLAARGLCAGRISPVTGGAVAP